MLSLDERLLRGVDLRPSVKRVNRRSSSNAIGRKDKPHNEYPQLDVRYVSAIALQLSSKLHQDPKCIADTLVMQLVQDSDRLLIPDAITASPEGYITVSLSEPILLQWLKQLSDALSAFTSRQPPNLDVDCSRQAYSACPLSTDPQTASFTNPDVHPPKNSEVQRHHPSTLFLSQYAHARCCAWLRMLEEPVFRETFSTKRVSSKRDRWTEQGNEWTEIWGDRPFQTLNCSWFGGMPAVDLMLNLLDSVDAICDEGLKHGYCDVWSALADPRDRDDCLIAPMVEKWLLQLSQQVLAFQAENPPGVFMQSSDRQTVDVNRLMVRATQQWLQILLTNILAVRAPTFL